jgi:hypothetical protein
MKKIPFSPPPKLERKKGKAPWLHAWGLPISCMKFLFPREQSPFLAWANTPCKEHHPTYRILET